MIKKITLIGSGNVAHNLGKAFILNGFDVVEVYSRTKANAKALAEKLDAKSTNNLSEINKESDLYIIATTDNAIEKIVEKLDFKGHFVVHTSGSVSIDVFENSFSHFGSFYPLQTFTKSHQADFKEIPICVEGNNEKNLELFKGLANKLSNKVVELSSAQRQKLHLSAVFVSNFANYMQVIGEDLCEEQQVDFELLKPLIKEVFHKNQKGKAINNQTGPALRGDSFTMNKHLELLKDKKELHQLYELLSGMIQNK